MDEKLVKQIDINEKIDEKKRKEKRTYKLFFFSC